MQALRTEKHDDRDEWWKEHKFLNALGELARYAEHFHFVYDLH